MAHYTQKSTTRNHRTGEFMKPSSIPIRSYYKDFDRD